MAAGYLEILRARHATRLLVGHAGGPAAQRAPPHIAIVLFTRAEGGSYSLAGALAAVYGVSNAVGQPLLGRAVDLYGQPRVQLPAAVLSALGMALLALAGTRIAAARVRRRGRGRRLFTPPLEGGLRALWPTVLGARGPGAPRVRDGRGGPGGHVHRRAAAGDGAGLALVARRRAARPERRSGCSGRSPWWSREPSRTWRSAPREAHWLGALRSPGLLALLGAFFFVGIALGSITVAGVAYADDHGRESVYGWLMAALGLGALIGGVVYGARQWAGAPERRLRVLVALLALCYLPLMLTPGVVAMTVLAALAGVFLAPAIACSFIVVDRHAPRGTVTEAFSWLVTTFGVGAAVGNGRGGPGRRAGRDGAGLRRRGGRRGGRAAGSAGHGTGPRSSRAYAGAVRAHRKMIETVLSNPVSAQGHQA